MGEFIASIVLGIILVIIAIICRKKQKKSETEIHGYKKTTGTVLKVTVDTRGAYYEISFMEEDKTYAAETANCIYFLRRLSIGEKVNIRYCFNWRGVPRVYLNEKKVMDVEEFVSKVCIVLLSVAGVISICVGVILLIKYLA